MASCSHEAVHTAYPVTPVSKKRVRETEPEPEPDADADTETESESDIQTCARRRISAGDKPSVVSLDTAPVSVPTSALTAATIPTGPSAIHFVKNNPVLIITDHAPKHLEIVKALVSTNVVAVVCVLSTNDWTQIMGALVAHRPTAVVVLLSHSFDTVGTNAFDIHTRDGRRHLLTDKDLVSAFTGCRSLYVECVLFVGAYTNNVASSLSGRMGTLHAAIGMACKEAMHPDTSLLVPYHFLRRLQAGGSIVRAVEDVRKVLPPLGIATKSLCLFADMLSPYLTKDHGFLAGYPSCTSKTECALTVKQLSEEARKPAEERTEMAPDEAGAASGKAEDADNTSASEIETRRLCVRVVGVIPLAVFEYI